MQQLGCTCPQELQEARADLDARQGSAAEREAELQAQVVSLKQEACTAKEEAATLRRSLLEASEHTAALRLDKDRLDSRLQQHSQVRPIDDCTIIDLGVGLSKPLNVVL